MMVVHDDNYICDDGTLREHDDSCCMVMGGLFQIIVCANWHNTVQAIILLPRLYSKGTPQMEYS